MDYFMIVICSILLGLIGRIAGGWKPPHMPEWLRTTLKVCQGYLLIPIFWPVIKEHPDAFFLLGLVGPLFWLGEKPGVGHFAGWLTRGYKSEGGGTPETWQILGLENSPWASAAVRGAMYPSMIGFVALLAMPFTDAGLFWLWLMPLYALTNVLGFFLPLRLRFPVIYFHGLNLDNPWGWSEFLRHFIAGMILGLAVWP
jgi:hypothetical protein